MSQKASPTIIGIFVFGAILIAIGAVVFFGSGDLFTKKQNYVSYFDQSVSGLAIGSNVKFKGVNVGKVTKVLLGFASENQPVFAKVYYEIDQNLLVRELGPGGVQVNLFDPKQHERSIDRGLRAKLEFESLISGQLFVSLDFFKEPDPAQLHHRTDASDLAYEIPVQKSDIEAILGNLTKAISNIGNVDFLSLSKDLQKLIVTTQVQIDALDLKTLSGSLSNLITGPDIKGSLASLKQAFDQLDATLKNLDKQINPITENLNPTVAEAKKTMQNLQVTTGQLNKMLSSNSGFRYQLDNTLAQLGNAAQSLQRLSEFLERNPNSLIFGRKPSKTTQER